MISTSSRSLAQPFNMAPKNNSMAEMNAYTAAWLDRCADEAAAARAAVRTGGGSSALNAGKFLYLHISSKSKLIRWP